MNDFVVLSDALKGNEFKMNASGMRISVVTIALISDIA
jgi:hypothetical protein